MFTLHPQLEKDCITLGDLPLCRVLLMNNHHFPWLILVPKRENMRELFDLAATDYHTVMNEIRSTTQQFQALTKAEKMNIAALGNMVPQLHIHIIARYKHDNAWPNPVWNTPVKGEIYGTDALAAIAQDTKKILGLT